MWMHLSAVRHVRGPPYCAHAQAQLDSGKAEYHLHMAAAQCKLGSFAEAVAVCDEVKLLARVRAHARICTGMRSSTQVPARTAHGYARR